jgi:hypothetical protein
MKTKVFGLAAIGLICYAGVAAAQNTPQSTPTPSPQTLAPEEVQGVLQALAKQRAGAVANASTATQSGSKSDVQNLSAPIPLGWNFAHATNCGWFVDSGGGQWFYIFPLEGGIVFTINNLYTGQALQISCVDGNIFAIHVVNSSTGAFDQTLSYPFK